MPRRLAVPLLSLIAAFVGSSCIAVGVTGVAGAQSNAGSSGQAGSPGPGGVLTAKTSTKTQAVVTLSGAGANSIDPLFEKVFFDYHRKNWKTTVNYSPAGSSVGVSDIQQSTVDFADSEIPMSSTDLTKATGGTVLQVPVDLGGVALSYNLPGAPKNLKLDGPTVAAIFAGTITKWNDPQIERVSGASNLPDTPIVPVHRADSSGPGWDLDAYLIQTAPAWVAKIGTSTPSKTWPLQTVGIGQQLNTGVASYIHQTPGAIGYIEYGYAQQAGFTNIALQNRSGRFVAPSEASIAAAGSQATNLSATNFSIIDEPGTKTYPLANFSWTLLYQKQTDQGKGIAAGKLFQYVVTTGQKSAGALGYAPLPANVVALAESTLAQLQTASGSPLFTTS